MRQLGLLFGNTAHAAAATLAVFFLGLAVGGWFWGNIVSPKHLSGDGPSRPRRRPLRIYAWLEVGIACTALLYFGVMSLFRLIYPAVYQSMGSAAVLFLVKCLLAMILVFPPAFFMGGTIPAMGQHLIIRRELFGKTTARIYGINTLGAALGVLMAAFLGVPLLGFRLTCIAAMVITGSVAAAAFWLSRGTVASKSHGTEGVEKPDLAATHRGKNSPRKNRGRGRGVASPQVAPAARGRDGTKRNGEVADASAVTGIKRPMIVSLAFLSGFSVLALEVLWTRMFAQVHENSVYSFATVLVIVLVCLSLGALLAAWLAASRLSPRHSLSFLLLASGVVLSFSPLLFVKLTDNFSMIPTAGSFAQYFRTLFTLGLAIIGPPCLLLGVVFPFLMKSEEHYASHPGRSIGYLSAVNTVGAIMGSLVCGFLLLRAIGMWWTVHSFAALYLLAGMILPADSRTVRATVSVLGLGFLVLLFTGLNPSGLPVIGTDPSRGPQKVVEVWETSDCSVAVVEDASGHLAIKVNSNYVLGSTDAFRDQIFQARIPLFAYPGTESVFFLGLGTGMTAGGALDTRFFRSVERVVACDLVPEVVTAARRYMAGGTGSLDYTNGLFTDERVEILIEDGRHYLMATDATYDMINADLFLPYRSGAGSLYSREHFESAKKRLNPEGVFVQWLPLYQLTEFEFGSISRTMLNVFDQVTLWRNNFMPGGEIVALIGHQADAHLPACELEMGRDKRAAVLGKDWRNLPEVLIACNEKTVSLFYCGNVTASKGLFEGYPINTDDRPVIEYMAPRSIRKKGTEMVPATLVGPRLADLVDELLKNCPPEHDPMLASRTGENRRLPLAGAALHRAWVGFAMSDPDMCRRGWEVFVREWTNER